MAGAAPTVRLALAGDVMTGRGIDQVLGHPGDPTLYERFVTDARDYVRLAEQASGPIDTPVADAELWGVALPALRAADVCMVNLETAVTDRGTPWSGKGIHYRMHPANVGCLQAADLDVVNLANNHALDWSRPGLAQTLAVLDAADVMVAGAGPGEDAAWAPTIVPTGVDRRVLVVGLGARSSGIPDGWQAGPDQAGIAVVDLTDPTARARAVADVASRVRPVAGPGDVVIASIHWGANWGWSIPAAHRSFAHALLDEAGVHVVHGHSSHHPRAIEVHDGRLVLHGCGDLVTDYEGIRGHERFRGDLGAVYLVDVDRDGGVQQLELVPTRMRRLRLSRPGDEDRRWLATTLARESARFGVDVVDDGPRLRVAW